MQAIDRRISAARQAAHESRGPADERELRRPGAERRGGQGAREGKSVARPARRPRRETQIARLLVPLLAGLVVAGASQGAPPGGPPDTKPPHIVQIKPESGAGGRRFSGEAPSPFGAAGGTGGRPWRE